MTIWVLLMVLLNPLPRIGTAYVLKKDGPVYWHATYEECKKERDRIGFAMAEAYPYEMTFTIECRETTKKP